MVTRESSRALQVHVLCLLHFPDTGHTDPHGGGHHGQGTGRDFIRISDHRATGGTPALIFSGEVVLDPGGPPVRDDGNG